MFRTRRCSNSHRRHKPFHSACPDKTAAVGVSAQPAMLPRSPVAP
jgi:hypothetical protein